MALPRPRRSSRSPPDALPEKTKPSFSKNLQRRRALGLTPLILWSRSLMAGLAHGPFGDLLHLQRGPHTRTPTWSHVDTEPAEFWLISACCEDALRPSWREADARRVPSHTIGRTGNEEGRVRSAAPAADGTAPLSPGNGRHRRRGRAGASGLPRRVLAQSDLRTQILQIPGVGMGSPTDADWQEVGRAVPRGRPRPTSRKASSRASSSPSWGSTTRTCTTSCSAAS